MPNLAGFDLVIEVARAAIERQILVTPSQIGPNGEVIDTFVPPFTLRQNISLPGMSGLLQLIVHELQLRAVPRTPLLIMHMSFAESSIEAPGLGVAMLAGEFDLRVPMRFTPPSGSPSQSRFALDFTAATASLQLSPDTLNRLQAQLGPTTANVVLTALNEALVGVFRAQGLRPVGFSFTIDGTTDSMQMTTLTAVPSVSWIDAETLGLFGYHRREANTGDVLRKSDSDLPPPPFAGFPGWYPVVVMLSPDSFQRLIACPAVTKAATDHVAGPVREGFINEERARDNNNGPATEAEIAIANNRVGAYLASPAGLAEIASKTPAPCGRGALDQRVNLPDPFPATTAYIDWLSMSLGNGRLDINAKAHADVFCGSVQVTLPMWVQPMVVPVTQKINLGPVNKGEPQTEVDSSLICKLATDVLLSFLIGPFVGSIATVAAFAVAESLAESLVNSKILDQNLPVPQAGIDLPQQLKWRNLRIDPSALMLIGEWPGELLDPHTFQPRVDLNWKYDIKPSQTVPTRKGTFEKSCPWATSPVTRQFDYKLQAWDTTLKISTTEQDVPHPLRNLGWIVNLGAGYFTLQDGVVLRTPGEIVIPDPPDNSHLETRDEIVVEVSGNNKDGWTLHFRGEDGILNILINTTVIDGSGRRWHLGNNFEIDGQTIWLPDNYKQFVGECRKALGVILRNYQLVRNVPRWEQVITPEAYVEQTIREAVAGRELGAGLLLQKILAERPELVKGLFRE